jgi:hypothetical protein
MQKGGDPRASMCRRKNARSVADQHVLTQVLCGGKTFSEAPADLRLADKAK